MSVPFDDVDPVRRRMMASVRGRDTKPEMVLRRGLHALGYRYVPNDKSRPGKPDLSFPSRKKAVFANGCFWHCHDGCRGGRIPATRSEFWAAKMARNKQRDAEVEARLRAMGWDVHVVWECELRASASAAMDGAVAFLGPPGRRV